MGRTKPAPRTLEEIKRDAEVEAETVKEDAPNLSVTAADLHREEIQSNVESGSGEEEDEEEEDEEDQEAEEKLEGLTAEELCLMGKQSCRQGDFGKGTRLLIKAIDKKAETAEDGEEDPECASFWFEYGSAMLEKEEQAGDYFKALESGEASKPTNEGTEPADQTDEQYAWDALEQARFGFEFRLRKLEVDQGVVHDAEKHLGEVTDGNLAGTVLEACESGQFVPVENCESWLDDYSYCLLRLGDILQAHLRFEEAAKEYSESLWVAFTHRLRWETLQRASIPLAHCERVLCKVTSARKAVELSVFVLNKSLADGHGSDEIRKNYVLMLEDLQMQTAELEQLLAFKQRTSKMASQLMSKALKPTPTCASATSSSQESVAKIPPVVSEASMPLADVMRNLGLDLATQLQSAFAPPTSATPVQDLGIIRASKKRRQNSPSEEAAGSENVSRPNEKRLAIAHDQ